MYNKIIEARYTNNQQDTILVLHETESDGIIEEYIQPGSIQHKAIEEHGWIEEKLVDATAEFKRQQLASIAEIAKVSASTLYDEEKEKAQKELERIRHKTVAAEALHKIRMEDQNQQLEKIRLKIVEFEALAARKKQHYEDELKKSLETHAVLKKLETEAPEKIRSINKYVNDNLTTEKLEIALENFLIFVQTVNENQDAIDILTNKTNKKVKPKTVIEAVKHLL